MRSPLAALLVAALLTAGGPTGCAVFHENGRHLSGAVIDDGNWPKSVGGRIAMTPVAALALLLDAVLIHPVLSVPDAINTALISGHHLGRYVDDTFGLPIYTVFVFIVLWDIIAFVLFELLYILVPGMAPVTTGGRQYY